MRYALAAILVAAVAFAAYCRGYRTGVDQAHAWQERDGVHVYSMAGGGAIVVVSDRAGRHARLVENSGYTDRIEITNQ